MSVFETTAIILLLANLTAVGLLVWRRRPEDKPSPLPTPAGPAHLEAGQMQELNKNTQSAFEFAVNEAARKLHADLEATSANLNRLIVRLTTEVVEKELEDYRQSLAAARQTALGSLEQMQKAVEQKQLSLESDMDSELAKRREHLMRQLDEKLGQAVSAYIVESLGQGADLGAQKAFLLRSLERNKEMLKQDLKDGA